MGMHADPLTVLQWPFSACGESQMSFQYCTGLEEEFVFVGRLDNLGMSYLSLQALIDSTRRQDALAEETAVRAVALFDHEEVGSVSAQGKHCIHLLLLISLPSLADEVRIDAHGHA